MKQIIRKLILALLLLAGLMDVQQVYACGWDDEDDDWDWFETFYGDDGMPAGLQDYEVDSWLRTYDVFYEADHFDDNIVDFEEPTTSPELIKAYQSIFELTLQDPSNAFKYLASNQKVSTTVESGWLVYIKPASDFMASLYDLAGIPYNTYISIGGGEVATEQAWNLDANNDGIRDVTQDFDGNQVNDYMQDLDGDGQFDYFQDSDGDGIPDCLDVEPEDPWCDEEVVDEINNSSSSSNDITTTVASDDSSENEATPQEKLKEEECDSADVEMAKEVLENLKLLEDANYHNADSTSLDTLLDKASSEQIEYSISVRTYEDSEYKMRTKLNPGTSGFSYLDGSQNATIVIHTHPKNSVGGHNFTGPSGGDVLSLLKLHFMGASRLMDSYVVASDSSIYALHIDDVNAAEAYYCELFEHNEQYYDAIGEPVTEYGNFIEATRMRDIYDAVYDDLRKNGWGLSEDDAHDATMAYLLNSKGVSLLKKEPHEIEFKKINTTSEVNHKGKIKGYNSKKCN